MTREDCLAVLAAYQAAGARVVEYQQHPASGPYSAASPWVIRSWDRNGLMVEATDRIDALNWLIRYWIATEPR